MTLMQMEKVDCNMRPSPLKESRLSCGNTLYYKRDDLFEFWHGGVAARYMPYLAQDLADRKYSCLLMGAACGPASMTMVAACVRVGMRCVCVLSKEQDMFSVLQEQLVLLGVDLVICHPDEIARTVKICEKQLATQGYKPWIFDSAALQSADTAAAAFACACEELREQAEGFDYVFAGDTGSLLPGLMAGRSLTGGFDHIVALSGDEDAADLASCAKIAATCLGQSEPVSAADTEVLAVSSLADSAQILAARAAAARQDGVYLGGRDGAALAGALTYLRERNISGQRVLFWVTEPNCVTPG